MELLAVSGAAYGAMQNWIDSLTQITATFASNTVPAGTYSIRLTQTDGDSALFTNAFQVLPAGEAKLETHLIVPSELGYHGVATIYVEYGNTGNAAMPAPLLVLTATQNGKEGAWLTTRNVHLVEGFWTSA